MKTMLEQSESDDDCLESTMKSLRLVNQHLCSWSTRAIGMLRPPNVPLSVILEAVATKFVNVKSLKLDKIQNIGDEDLVEVCKLSTLTCLDLSPITCFYDRNITDIGVNSLGSLSALKELNLGNCPMITELN